MKQISEAFGRRLKPSGLTRIQWIALYYIHVHDRTTQTVLSEMMQINVSSGARLIDRLERDGYVNRLDNPEDRRVHHITLTSKGKAVIEETMPVAVRFNQDLVQEIPDGELVVFERVMRKMLKNVVHENDL